MDTANPRARNESRFNLGKQLKEANRQRRVGEGQWIPPTPEREMSPGSTWGKGESICRYGQDGSKRNWIKKPMILIPLSLLTVKWRGRISRALSPTPPCWGSAESLTKARLTQSAKGWKGF